MSCLGLKVIERPDQAALVALPGFKYKSHFWAFYLSHPTIWSIYHAGSAHSSTSYLISLSLSFPLCIIETVNLTAWCFFATIWMLYGEWDPKEYFLGLNVSFEVDKCVVKYSLKWTKLRNPLRVEGLAESLLTIKVVQNKPQKLCHFDMQTILSWRKSKPNRFKKNFYPPLVV